MASEKIAKAYRFRDTSTSHENLLTKHAGFTKFMNSFLLTDRVKQMYTSREQLTRVTSLCRQLAGHGRVRAPLLLELVDPLGRVLAIPTADPHEHALFLQELADRELVDARRPLGQGRQVRDHRAHVLADVL